MPTMNSIDVLPKDYALRNVSLGLVMKIVICRMAQAEASNWTWICNQFMCPPELASTQVTRAYCCKIQAEFRT